MVQWLLLPVSVSLSPIPVSYGGYPFYERSPVLISPHTTNKHFIIYVISVETITLILNALHNNCIRLQAGCKWGTLNNVGNPWSRREPIASPSPRVHVLASYKM